MAVYQVTGPDGNLYRIEGPEGATDAEVIAAVRSQIEAETASASTAPMSIEDQVARDIELQQLLRRGDAGFFENILSGLGVGAIAPLESAALGAATLLDEEQELEAREAIQSAADYVSPSGGDPEALSYKLASGVGSLGAFLGTALLGPAALPAAGALVTGAGAGEASERARAAGVSEEERNEAAFKGIFAGALDIIPLGRFVSRLGVPILTDMVNKLGPKTVATFRDRIRNAAVTGGIEGGQEATAAVLQNAIEQGYNPDQTLLDGAAEEGGIGAFAGALLGLFLPGKTRDAAVDDAKDQADEILALPAPQLKLPAPETTVPEEAPTEVLGLGYEPTRTITMPDGSTQEVPSEFVERARIQEQEARAVEEADQQRRRAESEQGLAALQRVAREEAQTQELTREQELPEAELMALEEQRARGRAGDEQTDMFTLQRELEALQARPEETRAEPTEQLEIPEVTRSERGQVQREMFGPRGGVQRQPADTRQPEPKAGPQQQDMGFEQQQEQQEMLGPRGGVLRQPRTRALPRTPEVAPEVTPEAAKEQLSLFGPKGAPTKAARQPAAQPAPKAERKPVTATDLKNLGIPKISGAYNVVLGKDLNDPAQRQEVSVALDNYAETGRIKPKTKQKIQDFIAKADQDVQPVKTKPAAGGKGTKPSVPSTPEQKAPAVGRGATKPAGTGRTGLGASKPDTATTPVRAESKPTTLKAKPAPVATKPTPVAAKPTPTAAKPTTKPRKKGEAIPASEVAERIAAGRANQKRVDKATDELKAKRRYLEELKAIEAEKNAEKRKANEAAVMERIRQDLKKEKGIDASIQQVRAAVYVLVKRKKSTGTTKPSTTQKTSEKKLPPYAKSLGRPLDTTIPDQLSAADKFKIKNALQEQPAVRPRTEEQAVTKALHIYFGRFKRPMDGLFAAIYDMQRAAIEGEVRYRFPAETSQDIKDFFNGMNAENAARVVKWAETNLSNKAVVDTVTQNIAADMQAQMKALEEATTKDIDLVEKTRAEELKEAQKIARDEKEAQAKKEERISNRQIKILEEYVPTSENVDELAAALSAVVGGTRIVKSDVDPEISYVKDSGLRTKIKDDIAAFIAAGGRIKQYLLRKAVTSFYVPAHPKVQELLTAGDLKGALQTLAATFGNKDVARVAKILADYVGTTKVVVESDLRNEMGEPVAGFFDPATNTIKLDSRHAGNVHTILHETTHAVTSATLANKSHPLTKQLQKLYEEVKEALPDEYGSKSLDEFVAEAFTNPEFRQQLGGMRVGNEKVTTLQKFLISVGNFLRRLLGLQPVEAENMLTKVDGLIEAIIAPSMGSRNSGKLYMASATGTGGKVVDDAQKNPPKITKETIDSFLELLKSAVPQKVKDAALSLLPIDQLSDLATKYVPAVKKFNDLIQEEVGRLNEVRNKIEAPIKSIAKWVNSSSKDVQKAFNDLIHLSTLYQVDPEKPRSDYEGKTDASGNDKAESWDIVNKLWVKVGEDGHTQYRTARNIYRYTFSLLKDSISARLDAAGVDSKTKKRAMDEILAKMTKSAIEPYFALTRSGDFRVSYNAVDPNTKNFETYVSFFESDFARTRFLQQLRQELYKENKSAIDKLAREKKISVQDATNSFHSVSKFNKIEDGTFASAPQASFIGTIIKTLEANNVSPEAKADIIELMLNSMPERSIARALQSRNEGGVLGFDNDAVKALKSKSFSLSNQLVRMEYSSKLSKVETEIREQLKKSRNSADPELTTYLGNEVLRRIPFARRPDLPNWARNLRLFGFTMTLGLNVSSATVNLFQLPMVVMPYIAPIYGGFGTVSGSIGKATRLFANSGTNRKLDVVSDKLVNGEVVFETKTVEGGVAGRSLDNYFEVNSDGSLRVRNDMGLTDAQKREVQELAELVEVAGDMAQLNRSITYDLLEMDKTSSLTDKMAAVSGFVFHHSERLNRQVTLATIYDLEIKKRKKAKGKLSRQDRIEAAREAVRITDLTNGGTAAAGTARIAQNGLGSVVMLFKRYGISMYYLLTKTLNDALRGASPEAKKLARQQFAGIFGTTALLAGARGLPFFGALAMIYNLFADDDEERFEEVVAKHFGEPINGGMLNYLTGLDIGSRVALSDLIFRAPRIEKDQSAIWTMAESLGGPALGSAMAVEYGVRLLGQGEIQRGVEQVSPAAIRNILKTYRYADDDGVLTRRGDPVIEDLNGFNLGAQFFGFAPAEYTQKMAINATQKRKDRKITTDKTSLLRKYYIAMRQGDSKEVNKIMRDILEFNRKNPLVAITPDTIKRSMSQHMRTTQRMYNGVLFSPKLSDSLIQDASEYDSDISIWQ
jgi:hypothetical protein